MKLEYKKFAEYYAQTGNATESYKKAYPGCKTDGSARAGGNRLLTNSNVREYIEKLSEEASSKRIADMQEVKELWSNIIRGMKEEADMKDVLKASEYIAKTNGAFLDKVEHSGAIEINIDIEEDDEDD